MKRPSLLCSFSLISLTICSALSGCATFGPLGQPSLPKEEASITNNGQCTVKFHDGRKTQEQLVNLAADTRIQTILDQTEAFSKFRRMNVIVLRKSNKKPNQIVKLVANVDFKKNQVSLETDYAILPGDQIIIKKDNSTIFERAIGSVIPAAS